jgi:hypothetical protein
VLTVFDARGPAGFHVREQTHRLVDACLGRECCRRLPAILGRSTAILRSTDAPSAPRIVTGSALYVINADGSGLSQVPGITMAFDPAWRPE